MNNVEALKGLYVALGGDVEDVADLDLTVDVLNAIAEKYEGDADASLISDAISNISAVAENIGGGGNPNVVMTITGTMANWWGEENFSAIRNAIANKTMTVYVEADATALGFGTVNAILTCFDDSAYISAEGASLPSSLEVEGATAYSASWSNNNQESVPQLDDWYMLSNSTITDISEYASAVPTVATLIYHPLPETEGD